ncbi:MULTISPECIES: hypothetical protein [Pandoraea]|uniref:hypothetical protein n=1 Tax=Pandoraea TaxID=93217 RepID=UPI00123FFB4B|nr:MULTISPECIES: hypothetical protein [Pandoraea]
MNGWNGHYHGISGNAIASNLRLLERASDSMQLNSLSPEHSASVLLTALWVVEFRRLASHFRRSIAHSIREIFPLAPANALRRI